MIVLRLDLYAERGTQVVSAGQFLYVACHGDILPSPGTAGVRVFSIAVHVTGSYAYVADGLGGLRVGDVSNPVAPGLVAAYNTPGTALGIFVADEYSYVADGGGGLFILR